MQTEMALDVPEVLVTVRIQLEYAGPATPISAQGLPAPRTGPAAGDQPRDVASTPPPISRHHAPPPPVHATQPIPTATRPIPATHSHRPGCAEDPTSHTAAITAARPGRPSAARQALASMERQRRHGRHTRRRGCAETVHADTMGAASPRASSFDW